jgi:hypothetical protein
MKIDSKELKVGGSLTSIPFCNRELFNNVLFFLLLEELEGLKEAEL